MIQCIWTGKLLVKNRFPGSWTYIGDLQGYTLESSQAQKEVHINLLFIYILWNVQLKCVHVLSHSDAMLYAVCAMQSGAVIIYNTAAVPVTTSADWHSTIAHCCQQCGSSGSWQHFLSVIVLSGFYSMNWQIYKKTYQLQTRAQQ